MSQPSIASFFNTRKRIATDELTTIKNRVSSNRGLIFVFVSEYN